LGVEVGIGGVDEVESDERNGVWIGLWLKRLICGVRVLLIEVYFNSI
jgi:hypothetical protein